MRRTVAEALRQARLLFAPKRGNQSSSGHASPTQSGLVPPTPSDATKFLNGASTPAFAQVKGSDLSMADVTTNDVSITKHGFAPKAPNDVAKFLRGDGTWAAPASGGSPYGPFGPLMARMVYCCAPTGSSVTNFACIGDTSSTVGALPGNGGFPGLGATTLGQSGMQGAAFYTFTQSPFLQCAYGFGATPANVRVWLGMTDQSGATMNGSANPAGNYAAFRFDTSAGDTTWKCITKDGTTQTIVDSGVAATAVATATPQQFAIDFDYSTGKIMFYIAGVLVATITTHLPTATTSMRWVMVSNTLTSSFQVIYYHLWLLSRNLV